MAQLHSDANKSQQQRAETEIRFLQHLKDLFLGAKQELNNDLTRLAMRNLPIMDDNSKQHIKENSYQINLHPSIQDSTEPDQGTSQTHQQLEPLDLNL